MGQDERRGQALLEYGILDTPREQDFDEIAELAANICETPIAVVNLIAENRQFFKAEIGLGARAAPLDGAFCRQAVLEDELLVVADALQDPRFAKSPLVEGPPHLRFYAGARLTTPQGVAIGTVCVLDHQPRTLTETQKRALKGLARQAMAQLELRRLARLESAARLRAESGEHRYRAVFDSAVDYAIVVLDQEGVIRDWNEGAVQILGWSRAEAVGKDVELFFTPEDRDHAIHKKEMASAYTVGRGMDERWHLRKSGERFWASGEMMPLRQDDETLVGYVKILRDQTGQRLAEERLKASEKRWRELFEQMAEGFFVGELIRDEAGRPIDYRFIEINPAFAAQSGIPASAVGTTIRAYASDVPQQLIDHCAIAVETGEPQSFEIEIQQLGRWFDVRCARESEGRFLCLFFDITARKSAEQERELLTGELAHRVKNTFSVVQAIVAQTLRKADPVLGETLQNRLAALSKAHGVLLQTNWETSTVESLAVGVLSLQAEPDRFDLAGPAVMVGAKTALSLSLLLHELATNALKYGALSVDGGRVNIRWSLEEDEFRLVWQEVGGPPATRPERRGFGSRLIEMGINGARDTQLDYGPTGLTATFTAVRGAMAS
ncbi:PAS domain S-box protein [Rhizobium sp. YIM 134829]|uniref:PAS domain S-box protein n=1 Tax=Rhizobium sp. YIM 134829 TaxID=3390453 RepID=UPI00397D2C56